MTTKPDDVSAIPEWFESAISNVAQEIAKLESAIARTDSLLDKAIDHRSVDVTCSSLEGSGLKAGDVEAFLQRAPRGSAVETAKELFLATRPHLTKHNANIKSILMRRSAQKRSKDAPKPIVKTFRFRVKDSSTDARVLKRMSRCGVDVVWNFCNAAQLHALKHNARWPDDDALQKLTAGSSNLLGISSQTVQAICEEYVSKRRAAKKAKLRFRGKKSLGWVPFKNQTITLVGNSIVYCGHTFRLWKHREIPATAIIKSGSFSQDARGRWYCNIACELPHPVAIDRSSAIAKSRTIGGDFGLKTWLTLSSPLADGRQKIQHPRAYRVLESKLGSAQRANKSKLAKTISAKIANVRRDFLHQETTKIANQFDLIFIGNVSAKWQMSVNGKSAADAAWGMSRDFLRYKAIARGGVFGDVSEYQSTQSCSECDALGGPKGTQGLVIRDWVCDECGTVHDRDINSAKIHLRRGLATLVEGAPPVGRGIRSPSLQGGE